MDPVTIIVGALVQGLLAGVQDVGRDAVVDSYQLLKTLLVRRFGQRASAEIENLEQHPQSQDCQHQLHRTLSDLGAGRDLELVRLAEQLTDLVEQGAGTDPLEQSKRVAGVRAVTQVMDRHVATVSHLRSVHRVDDTDLLSSNVARARDVPGQVRAEIGDLHNRIRAIIEQIATSIEGAKYQHTEHELQALTSRNERDRAARLVTADKQLHVSYESLRLTVEFFSELNSTILARIAKEPSAERQAQMMFGNAVMIYELADYVISFIEQFSLAGVDDLDALHRETLGRLAKIRQDQADLAAAAEQDGIEPAVREGILEDVRNREAAVAVLEEEWARYVDGTRQFHGRVTEVQHKVPTLALIRDNARVQLNVLELVAMLRFLKQNADAVRAAVDTLQGFRLEPLTPTRVRRLIGVHG